MEFVQIPESVVPGHLHQCIRVSLEVSFYFCRFVCWCEVAHEGGTGTGKEPATLYCRYPGYKGKRERQLFGEINKGKGHSFRFCAFFMLRAVSHAGQGATLGMSGRVTRIISFIACRFEFFLWVVTLHQIDPRAVSLGISHMQSRTRDGSEHGTT